MATKIVMKNLSHKNIYTYLPVYQYIVQATVAFATTKKAE